MSVTDTGLGNRHAERSTGSPGEVFTTFLKLGLTSFGGPIAHLGYFREEIVVRRKWLSEQAYADLVALCQFLPGPASSQVGFALGLMRGGPLGAMAAWAAFTLPSAILLVAFAYGAAAFTGPISLGLIHGLKIVAVAVVAQAVWGMAKSLTPDRTRATIALLAVCIVVFLATSLGQLIAIVAGAVLGLVFCRIDLISRPTEQDFPVSKTVGVVCLALFVLLLTILPLLAHAFQWQGLIAFDSFFRSGAFVFGGGHVVLPLLETEVVQTGMVSHDAFLAGYGATQAVPGPLFTFAAYLGATLAQPPNGVLGAAICLIAIFLPGFLLLMGALPFWSELRDRPAMQAAMKGANAAVVGLLGAALYNPVWTSAILNPYDFALALAGFLLLTMWKTPPWLVVMLLALGGAVLGQFA
jgi:chromate transporter